MARRAKDKKWKSKLSVPAYQKDISPDQEDSGVHLDEPSTPQAWEDDLDMFIRQLTDPKSFQNAKLPQHPMHSHHHGNSSGQLLSSSKSEHVLSLRVNEKRLSTDMDKKCTLLQTSRSTTFTTNCQYSNSGNQKPDNKSVLQRQQIVEVSSGCFCDEDLGIDNDSPPVSPKDKIKVTFTCDSSPEVSDEDGQLSPTFSSGLQDSGKSKEKGSKKSRFRKMITRPLRRSCSAGNPKDVPAYALFLQFNPGSLPEKSSMEEQRRAPKAYSEPHVSEACDSENQSHKPVRKVMSDEPAAVCNPGDKSGSQNQTATKSNSRSKIARHVKRKLQFLRRRHTDTALGESTAKFQEGKMNFPSKDEAIRWSYSFDTLLNDKCGLQMFRQFLRSEFSEENIEFWIACEEFRHTRSTMLPAKAQIIYADYVAVHAPKEINLDSKTRMATISNMTSLTRKTFHDAQKRIQALMEKDSYPRFLQSGMYKHILASNRK